MLRDAQTCCYDDSHTHNGKGALLECEKNKATKQIKLNNNDTTATLAGRKLITHNPPHKEMKSV